MQHIKRKIQYIVIDIDGTMTDAGIYYDDHGNELKKFCLKDSAGFYISKYLGIKTIIITGRQCPATLRRMEELDADFIFQNIVDKAPFLKDFMEKNLIRQEELAYIGDDLNDLAAMKYAGYIGCPSDSCQEIRCIADYISTFEGGRGAVRDVIEHILRESGEWESAVEKVYGPTI